MLARRIVDLALLSILLAGGAWAWWLGVERAGLEAELARLTARTGALTVGNPKLIHARALRGDGPLAFGWRVFVPTGKSLRSGLGQNTSTSTLAAASESAIRVAFREVEGRLMLFVGKFGGSGGSSSTGEYGDDTLADLLRGRWDRVVVEEFGRDEVAVADPGRPLTLLRLSLPPDLIEEARAKLSPQSQRYIPVLYTLTIP